ncbi:unnamed protein product [Auanema sp. JU1783]|nr:unnamed protein product [Auanema sp. JU1783]
MKNPDIRNSRLKHKGRNPREREKLRHGDIIKSELYTWRVINLLGSGGFGDVYRVIKLNSDDNQAYAMKTEVTTGDRRLLRLKVEVTVSMQVLERFSQDERKHFVEFVDRGMTDHFKFFVMSLIGPSLEDVRRNFLLRNYSKPTVMVTAVQTLKAIGLLHQLGWIHRDIKPQNFAVGVDDCEKIIYILDFGIARRFCDDNRVIRTPRLSVKFMGTIRFASRAAHIGLEQDRKDDLETWLYMVFDLFDDSDGLPWKRAVDRADVIRLKKHLMEGKDVPRRTFSVTPPEFKILIKYIGDLKYGDDPDYKYIHNMLEYIATTNDIALDRRLDWIGKLHSKQTHNARERNEHPHNQRTSTEDSE